MTNPEKIQEFFEEMGEEELTKYLEACSKKKAPNNTSLKSEATISPESKPTEPQRTLKEEFYEQSMP